MNDIINLQEQTSMAQRSNNDSGTGSNLISPNINSRQLTSDDDDSGCPIEEYSWVPPGLKPDQVLQYFSSIPEDRIPYVNSHGEKYRVKQLLYQIPPHDNEPKYCNRLAPMEAEQLRLFSQVRKRESLGRAVARQIPLTNSNKINCRNCEKPVENGTIGIFAARAGAQACWHPGCFTCYKCNELLADLIYFFNAIDSQVYCGRHHAEIFKPRCPACDELIFSDECTEAEGRSWHMDHFACFNCNTLLGGQKYYIKQSKPYCCDCHEKSLVEICATCHNSIQLDQGQMSCEDLHWHATDECFKCYKCSISLLGRSMLPLNGGLYCADCGEETKSKMHQFVSSPILSNLASPINDVVNTFESKLLLNQSRSRKPFNMGIYDDNMSTNELKNSILKQRIREQEGVNNSFDDLDSVEIISLSQHNLVKSRYPLTEVQPQFKQPVSILAKKQKSNLINNKNPYVNDENEVKKPVSILKRNEEDKMYPISRPMYPHQAQIHHNMNTYPMGMAVQTRANNNRRFVQNTNPYASIPDAEYFDMHKSSKMSMNQTLTNGSTRKRVQFANTPSMHSASSEGDLSAPVNSRVKPTSGHHYHKPNHHSHRRHHNHNHHGHSHRRSSSTSNFNTSSMSCRSHNPHMGRSGYGRSSFRQYSNRSLNAGDIESDYYDPNEPCTCEYDDDQNTCSTCSSNTTTSTTSTDSDSDMDDFGCDPLDNYYKMYYNQYNNNANRAQFDQRSFQGKLQTNTTGNGQSNQGSLNRRFNSGIKISYVDSLPLARTNPAPSKSKSSKEDKEKNKTTAKGEKRSQNLKRTIVLFLKLN